MQFFFTTLLADAVKLKQTSFEYCTCKLILWRSDFHPVPSGRRDASLKETRTERHQRGVRPLSEVDKKKCQMHLPVGDSQSTGQDGRNGIFGGFDAKASTIMDLKV